MIFLYIILFIVFIWSYCLYIIYIISSSNKKHDNHVNTIDEAINHKKIVVLVPFFNEEAILQKKFDNLRDLETSSLVIDYIFIDAGSTDKSKKIIETNLNSLQSALYLNSPDRGKIHQLNFALEKIADDTDYVFITDVDALCPPNILTAFLNIMKNPNVAVVGGLVDPTNTIAMDKYFWEDQNALRIIESMYISASTVAAPAYMFRKNLCDSFPNDCIADDAFISFSANLHGLKVIYDQNTRVQELRGPKTLIEFVQHKHRKILANIKETMRFFPSLSIMSFRWRFIFINRALQLLIIPFVFIALVILTLLIFLTGALEHQLILASSTCLAILFAFMTSKKLGFITQETYYGSNTNKFLYKIFGLFLINALIIFAIFCYPFVKQSSSYKRLV